MRLEKLLNPVAESVVLATMLYHAPAIDRFTELAARDFVTPEANVIFQAMALELAAGRRPTPFTVAPYLPAEVFGDRSPVRYVADMGRLSNPDGFAECFGVVKELSTRRAIADNADLQACQAWEAETSLPELLSGAMEALDALAAVHRRIGGTREMFADGADRLLAGIQATDSPEFISTGIPDLDKLLGGWPRGEMTIIGGRPSMGKSALLISAIRQAADKGHACLLFSLEMRNASVMARMLSDVAWSAQAGSSVPYEAILRREVDGRGRQRLANLLEGVRGYPIMIDDTPGLTAAEIRIRASRFADELDKQGKTLDIVGVDHLGKIKAGERYAGNMVHETGEKSNTMMHMGKELGAAMLVAHQLNRGPEGREEKRPVLADLRDAGNLEQDAHTVLFPYREAYYLERRRYEDQQKENGRLRLLDKFMYVMEVMVAKNRNGPCESVDLFADMACNAIRGSSVVRLVQPSRQNSVVSGREAEPAH